MAGVLGFFDKSGLPPHGFCLLWDPTLIWLNVVSDAVIGLSSYSIPLALAYFVARRRDQAHTWVLYLFAAFILACGTTHFMEIWVLWRPDYALQGVIKAITAAVSLLTAVLLWPLVIRVIAFPTPSQLRQMSDRLARETTVRQRTEASLRRSEESLRALVEGVTDHAIFLLDPSGGVSSSWNAGAARIKGYSEREVLGRHMTLFYTPEDRQAGVPLRALDVAARTGKYETEGWRVRKDGTRFWASVGAGARCATPGATCWASPRSRATSPNAVRRRRRWSRRARHSRRRRRWRRSASSPAASRTTSTTC